MRQVLAHQEALVGPDLPDQRPLQLGDLRPQAPFGQLRQGGRVGVPRQQARQDLAPRLAQDIGGDAGQLHVGALQRLLQPIALGGALPHQAGAIAGQLAQFPLRPVGHETRPQQAVL